MCHPRAAAEKMEKLYQQSQDGEIMEEIGKIKSNIAMMENAEYSLLKRKKMKDRSYRSQCRR